MGTTCRVCPVPLARGEKEDEPDRWVPPVGHSSKRPVALSPGYVFFAGKRNVVQAFSVAEKRNGPEVRLLLPKTYSVLTVFYFSDFIKNTVD